MGEVIYLGFKDKSVAFTRALDALPNYGKVRHYNFEEHHQDNLDLLDAYTIVTEELFGCLERLNPLVRQLHDINKRSFDLVEKYDE